MPCSFGLMAVAGWRPPGDGSRGGVDNDSSFDDAEPSPTRSTRRSGVRIPYELAPDQGYHPNVSGDQVTAPSLLGCAQPLWKIAWCIWSPVFVQVSSACASTVPIVRCELEVV